MNQPTIGTWYRVNGGPHRGKSGCCDLIKDYEVGTRYRLTSETEHVGWFAVEHLEPCASPNSEYVSKVAPAVQQQAMDMLVKRAS